MKIILTLLLLFLFKSSFGQYENYKYPKQIKISFDLEQSRTFAKKNNKKLLLVFTSITGTSVIGKEWEIFTKTKNERLKNFQIVCLFIDDKNTKKGEILQKGTSYKNMLYNYCKCNSIPVLVIVDSNLKFYKILSEYPFRTVAFDTFLQ